MRAKECQDKDLRRGIYSEYMIIEVDIPDEVIKQYVGLGFYNYVTNYLEFRIPYQVLYQLLGIKEDFIDEALAFYNANFGVENKESKEEYKRLEQLYQGEINSSNITRYSQFSLFPLLCFKLKPSINVMRFGDISNSVNGLEEYSKLAWGMWFNRDETYAYSRNLEKIAWTEEGTDIYDKNYSRDELFDFTTPIITEENKRLKLILEDHKYHF